MKTPDFIKNFEIVKKEKIKHKAKILENIINFSINFIEENSQTPSVLSINKKTFLYIKEIFFKNQQLSIPFIEDELNKHNSTPFLKIETDSGIFYISFISKGKYDYLKIKTPKNNIILLYLWITYVLSNEMFFIYGSLETPKDEYFQKTNPFIEFISKLELLLLQECPEIFGNSNNFLYKEYTFKKELSFFENIVFSMENFLYRNNKMPNVIIINDEKHDLIESLNNKGLLQREIIKIYSGVISEVQINLDNEDIIQILIEKENKENLYIFGDYGRKLNEFILLYDDSFHGIDNNDDDDDDDFIITPPIISPEFCEVDDDFPFSNRFQLVQ